MYHVSFMTRTLSRDKKTYTILFNKSNGTSQTQEQQAIS